MNSKLAAALDTYTQAKYAHWNVKGVNFYQLHLVFDATAKVIFKHIDAIAERITQLGGTANGTVRMAAEASPISPYNVEALSGPEHVDGRQVRKVFPPIIGSSSVRPVPAMHKISRDRT